MEKDYVFYFRGTIGGYGVVTASSDEEAKKKAMSGDYDDIIDTYDMEIKEVIGIRED